MKIERIIIGTHNEAKAKEWSEILGDEIEVLSVDSLTQVSDPDETGSTFQENARLKASGYATQIHEFVFSEDGGYEVDALGGLPGVKSRRILPGDKEGTDQELIDYVLDKVKGLPESERGVSLTSAAALSDPDGNIIFEDTEKFRGVISQREGSVKIPGYPFRSIHFLPELGKTYAELSHKEHKNYSHKRKIAERLIDFLKKEKLI